MAHTGTHTCLPQNIYGSYDQTLFLGCSVLSFTANGGINEQSSELTVELVQDKCIPPGTGTKTYFNTTAGVGNVGTPVKAQIADPGFTEPVIGSPCYLRVAKFEYAGILQSWTQKNDASFGYDDQAILTPGQLPGTSEPVYTVKLTDPRVLLDNVQLIVGEYQGKIKDLKTLQNWENGSAVAPGKSLTNIVNVYGFLDSLSANCPLINAGDVDFGAPAGGWGISNPNENGIPWNLVKSAVQVLLGNPSTPQAPDFSRGYIYGPPGGNRGYGEIFTGGTPYTVLAEPAKYILDISEIPFAPPYYRINGPVVSVSELISQVCRDAGCDYYIELLPTAGALVIKVRVIVRSNQPAMGQIKQYIQSAAAKGYVSNYTVGKEYRPDPTNSFIIGDHVRSVYQSSGGGIPTGTGLQIMPYWGRDLDGKLISGVEGTCEPRDSGSFPNNWLGPPDWSVRLDFREINNQLHTQFNDDTRPSYAGASNSPGDGTRTETNYGWVTEGELRAALGTFKSFKEFLLQPDPVCGWTSAPGQSPFVEREKIVPGPYGLQDSALRRYFLDLNATYGEHLSTRGVEGTDFQVNVLNVQVNAANPIGGGSNNLQDMRAVHKWLQSYAQEHYGRQWLVEIPFACWAGDSGNPDRISWSDQPSTQGGWTNAKDVIGLSNHPYGSSPRGIDRFKTEDGRYRPILRWDQNPPQTGALALRNPHVTGLKFDNLPADRFTTDLYNVQPAQGPILSVWQRGEISEEWVTGCPYLGTPQNRVFALITCEPVYTGLPILEGAREQRNIIIKSGLRDKVVGNIDPLEEAKPDSQKTLNSLSYAGQFSDRMLPPKAAAVPVLSNTQTYGPWWKEGITYGTMHTEVDSDLNPWNYGGTSFMTLAAIDKVQKSTTKMNIAERGEITIAGYPTKSLGAAITTTISLYATRNLNTQIFDAFFNISGVPYNFQYSIVPLVSNATSASISNMNVVVAPQGVTTSYTISTFTPVFGRFSKDNADRIKQIGNLKLKAERKSRETSAKQFFRDASAALKSRQRVSESSTETGPDAAQNSPGVLLGGYLPPNHKKRKNVVVGDRHTFSAFSGYASTAMMSFDGLFRPVSKGSGLYRANLPTMKQGSEYNESLCPSTGNKRDIGATGGYAGYNTGELNYQNVKMSIAPPPPINLMSGLIISANYLDPLADPISNAVFTNDQRSIGAFGTGVGSGVAKKGYEPAPTGTGGNLLITHASGHDIESVARGDLAGLRQLGGNSGSSFSGASMIIAGESGRYSGDYRFMAMRGPIVLHSWGYDTYGKPVPNSRGYSGDMSFQTGVGGGWDTSIVADTGNRHQKSQSGLTDRFAPNWLSDATNWPVAPVDLRYDRASGVWTTPPPFRLMKVQAVQDIAAGATGIVEILNGDDMFDHNGQTFSGMVAVTGYFPTGTGSNGVHTGTALYRTGIEPLVNIENFGGSTILKETTFGLYYDTHSCSYWPIGLAGGGKEGCDDGATASVTAVTNFRCVGDVIEACTVSLNFVDGCLVNATSGACW